MYDIQKSTTDVKGSINDAAKTKGVSVEEVLLDAEAIVIIDVSGSMNAFDAGGGQSRWQAANDALIALQRQYNGKLIISSFSTGFEWNLDGNIPRANGGTNLANALRSVRDFDGLGLKFIIVSDGTADNPFAAKEVAKTFVSPIDTIYIGPKHGEGQRFLTSLTTGQNIDHLDPSLLASGMSRLLGPASL